MASAQSHAAPDYLPFCRLPSSSSDTGVDSPRTTLNPLLAPHPIDPAPERATRRWLPRDAARRALSLSPRSWLVLFLDRLSAARPVPNYAPSICSLIQTSRYAAVCKHIKDGLTFCRLERSAAAGRAATRGGSYTPQLTPAALRKGLAWYLGTWSARGTCTIPPGTSTIYI